MKKHTNPRKKESQYIQGICVICNKNKQITCGICKRTGKRKYKGMCTTCSFKVRGFPNQKYYRLRYLLDKKSYCENCGFIPTHSCQLDVDHIDGNHKNNNPSNHRTICANCHRLKTYINKEWDKSQNNNPPDLDKESLIIPEKQLNLTKPTKI